MRRTETARWQFQWPSRLKFSAKRNVTPNVEEQIRARAYELYLKRGDNGGSPEQDWLRAVEEICGQQARKSGRESQLCWCRRKTHYQRAFIVSLRDSLHREASAAYNSKLSARI